MSADGATAAGSAVTIGAFDGVHLGHRRLVGELRRTADQRSLRCVVVTFDRHPASVVRPGSAPLLLTDLEQKVELLGEAGAGDVVVLQFDERRAAEPAEDFVREVLAGQLSARVVIVGSDFHFGNGRRGNVALLRNMGVELAFSVIGYELVDDEGDGGVISSTRIRSLLAAGDVEGAATLLGRHHEVRGALEVDGGRGEVLEVPASIATPAPGTYDAELQRSPSGGAERVHARVLAEPPGRTAAVVEIEIAGPHAPVPPGAPARRARLRFLAAVAQPAVQAPAHRSGA
jgi:riboflavin kinase/FMN adenylyltransferase